MNEGQIDGTGYGRGRLQCGDEFKVKRRCQSMMCNIRVEEERCCSWMHQDEHVGAACESLDLLEHHVRCRMYHSLAVVYSTRRCGAEKQQVSVGRGVHDCSMVYLSTIRIRTSTIRLGDKKIWVTNMSWRGEN